MKANKNQAQDALLKKAIRQVTPMSPGPDFLKNVMTKVESLPVYQASPVVYSPLITKRGWFIIVFVIMGLLAATFFTLSPDSHQFPEIQQYLIVSLDHFSILFSQVFVLGMVVLAALFIFQIWLLTRDTKKLV